MYIVIHTNSAQLSSYIKLEPGFIHTFFIFSLIIFVKFIKTEHDNAQSPKVNTESRMTNWEEGIDQYCKAWAWATVEKMKKFPKSPRR